MPFTVYPQCLSMLQCLPMFCKPFIFKSIRLFLALFLFVGITRAQAGGDLWIIDTHSAGEDSSRLRFLQSTGHGWEHSDRETFHATHDPTLPLLVVVHGNRTTFAEVAAWAGMFSRSMGSQARSSQAGSSKAGISKARRLVFWVWPAERVGHKIRRDARIKAARSDKEADRLTRFLHDLQPESKVALIGFSFGARLVGGVLERLATDAPLERPMRLRAALLAPAVDSTWFSPGGKFGNALNAVEQMGVYYNPEDKVLRFYRLLYGCHGPRPEALGKTGPPLKTFAPENAVKVIPINASGMLGRKHDFMASLAAFRSSRRFGTIALFEDDH